MMRIIQNSDDTNNNINNIKTERSMKPLLDKTQRKMLQLHETGWSVKNIAHILQVSPGSVKQTLLNQGIEPLM